MPVHIRSVNADLRTRETGPAPTSAQAAAREGLEGMSDKALTERLRPIVIEIMRRELDELRRRRGVGV